MRRALAAAVLALLVLVSSVSASHFVWRSATTNGTPEATLRNLIMAEHLRVCPARPLVADTRLVWLARYRSQDMVLNNYFSHTIRYSNRNVFSLMTTAGIKYATGGENIVWNSYPDDVSASAAYRMFMESSGHRALIRSCTYTRIGVGDYKVGSKRMFTVLFIKPA